MVELRSIRYSFDEWLQDLPEATQWLARGLPHRLGLTQHEYGAWEDFIILDPNRTLPWYAAQAPHDETRCLLGGARLDAFLRAHHAAGFLGLLCDRLDDAQVAPDPSLLVLRAELLRHWRTSLATALEDPARADQLTSGALRAMRRGTRLESRIRRRAVLRAEYGAATSLKLDWILVAARALLETVSGAARAAQFSRIFHLVLLALQCRDDVMDVSEDQRLHGVSMPSALGVSGTALLHAADCLLHRAEQCGRSAGFTRLANWLTAHAFHSNSEGPQVSPVQDHMTGLLLSWALEGGR